jgi:hypothetical protein
VHQPTKFARQVPWLYFAALAGANSYICAQAFTSNAGGRWNTMHGHWIALARLAGFGWLHPTWWRYWGGGEPLAFTYNPLIPFSIAAISSIFHCSEERALNALTAAVCCLGPLIFYTVSWRLSRRPGYSFAAAMACSLWSPVLSPMDGMPFWYPQRLLLAFMWDDLPHLTSLALLPIALWGLARALERRRPLDYAITGMALAGMMLANMFGFVLAAFLLLTVPLAMDREPRPALLVRSALLGAVTYILVSPWIPPSLLLTTRANESRNGEAPWTLQAALALVITAVVLAVVWRLAARHVANWAARWAILFGALVITIPVLAEFAGLHFLPQPGRYRIEADAAVIWLAVFALAYAAERIPRAVRVAALAPLLFLAGRQAMAFHSLVSQWVAPVDVPRSIEYRAAKWVAENLGGQRLFMTGSMGYFLNDFIGAEQLSAEPYTTTANWEEAVAVFTIYSGMNAGERDPEYSLLWLEAFGVQAIGVSGPRSPEFWKPFARPRKFDGVLPVLWSEDDTTIYRLPQASPWLVHPLRPDRLVHRPPFNGLDLDEVRVFVAAVESDTKGGTIAWHDANHARIRTSPEPGEIVATGITYNPGWHATVKGATRPVRADGIGLMAVDAGCIGPCEIQLSFDGGWEWRICLAASGATLLLLLRSGLRAMLSPAKTG